MYDDKLGDCCGWSQYIQLKKKQKKNNTQYFFSSFMYHKIVHFPKQKYLILLSISLGVVGVRVVLEKLSHICHDGFLVRLVNIHIYRATQTLSDKLLIKQNI